MPAPPTLSLSAGYDFLPPPRIVFGWGRRREVGAIARTLGDRRAFLVLGSRTLAGSGVMQEIEQSLYDAGLQPLQATTISREPEIDDVDHLVRWLREEHATRDDVLVAIGGGSAIDLAKAAGALVTQPSSAGVTDYLEGVGRGLAIREPPLGLVAVPTTGGTGSEATKNAVISSFDPPFKKSLRSERMLPRAVLVDPELAVTAPKSVTAASGLDAITQCIESYISRRAKPIPQALAAAGLRRAVPALREAVEEPASRPAREAMAHAALLSGMALANSGLGMAHGVAAALGVHAHVAHGLACAVMLPIALRTNLPACTSELAELARAVWDDHWPSATAAADALVARIDELCRAVGVPQRLRDLGVAREQIPALVAGAHGNSLDGNPITLGDDQLNDILQGCW
ncbi:MAG: iron-containing alcohol dehydrogenase [Planctomycetia bacterium]|nr:iron-containing alcohol dehydrogenase [Planctomycetia bacterium]